MEESAWSPQKKVFKSSLRETYPYLEYFWSVFPAFELNTERYFLFLLIRSECGKIQRLYPQCIFNFFSSPNGKISTIKTLPEVSLVSLTRETHCSIKCLKKGRQFHCTGFMCSSKPVHLDCKCLAFSPQI